MNNRYKAIAKLTSTTLANIAVVGFGLALFDWCLWCAFIAFFTFLLASYIEWRISNE